MDNLPLLSFVILLPWTGAVLLALVPRLSASAARAIGLLFSLSTLAFGCVLVARFDPAATACQFVERQPWMSTPNVAWHLGVDGLSLVLVLLTGLLSPLSLLASWRNGRDVRLFNILFLALQGSALGVFLALDFFPWFIFWELSLFPAFFLIRLWSGPAAPAAAYQFVIYTIGGSAFMLAGFAGIYAATGSFDFVHLASIAGTGELAAKLGSVSPMLRTAAFLGVLAGLAVKVPLYPLHTWLPPAYAEAPTGVSMFLTGILSKMGFYGFLRLLWPLFPEELRASAPWLLTLAVAGVVMGAYAAARQKDLKRMIAYSSVNHLSYCLLALFAVAFARGPSPEGAAASAFAGSILQMVNHGLSAAALFFCIGILESRSGGRRGLDNFGGIRTAAPVFAGLCGIAMFSSLGLPGLNGFVGEYLIFRGVFGLVPVAAVVSCAGLFATAWFLLTFWQRVFHGPRPPGAAAFADLDALECITLLPLIALMFLLGVLPGLVTSLFNPLVAGWAAGFR